MSLHYITSCFMQLYYLELLQDISRNTSYIYVLTVFSCGLLHRYLHGSSHTPSQHSEGKLHDEHIMQRKDYVTAKCTCILSDPCAHIDSLIII